MKRVIWMGSSRHDLKDFPEKVRRAVGHALHQVQEGERPIQAKVMSNFGNARVLEIRETDAAGTYRLVYTIEVRKFVFVLHVFQKKSKSGIATPKQEMELVKKRLVDAKALCKQLLEGESS